MQEQLGVATEPAPPEQSPRFIDRFVARLTATRPYQNSLSFYRRYEKYGPVVFFFGGVLWDATTLKRIDNWVDVAFLVGYLAVLGLLVVVATLLDYQKITTIWLVRLKEWFAPAIQFFLGSLFSAYVVYYSQSASLTESSLYLVILVAFLVGNEFIEKRLVNLYLLTALYFLVCFSFFIYFVPVLAKRMGYPMFLIGGLLSVLLVYGLLRYFRRKEVFQKRTQYYMAVALVSGLFLMMNLFYLQGWIPPVPLAMRYGGVYHDVNHNGNVFELVYERPPWYRFWASSNPVFHREEGRPVYCFAAVFAPTQLRERIYHRWQFYDETNAHWVETDRIGYSLLGGRDQGYRGYTLKRSVKPGKWRVDVITTEGHTIGRVQFSVKPASDETIRLDTLRYQ